MITMPAQHRDFCQPSAMDDAIVYRPNPTAYINNVRGKKKHHKDLCSFNSLHRQNEIRSRSNGNFYFNLLRQNNRTTDR